MDDPTTNSKRSKTISDNLIMDTCIQVNHEDDRHSLVDARFQHLKAYQGFKIGWTPYSFDFTADEESVSMIN